MQSLIRPILCLLSVTWVTTAALGQILGPVTDPFQQPGQTTGVFPTQPTTPTTIGGTPSTPIGGTQPDQVSPSTGVVAGFGPPFAGSQPSSIVQTREPSLLTTAVTSACGTGSALALAFSAAGIAAFRGWRHGGIDPSVPRRASGRRRPRWGVGQQRAA
ncbi:MAG TPA: hypothetical protein PKL76_05895 [Phycisphaerae bacterium]|nr:hypothetical protein [Phycisphaerae bacterium]